MKAKATKAKVEREAKADVDIGVMFLDCKCDQGTLTSYETKFDLDAAITESGFKLVSSSLNVFPGDGSGFTYLACIGESHVAIHTWPERGKVDVNVFYCNFFGDNSKKAKKLFKGLREIFSPQREENLETRLWEEKGR